MKKFIIAFALLLGIASFNNQIEAQNINISINIGRQPAWGPVGYDYAGYYYFPDIDCYYDVNMALFYYFDRGRWISARYLPYAYRNYDLYRLYKVVLNMHDPWRYHHNHYRDYARYRGHKHQVIIRDSRDYRYRDSRNNRVVWFSKDKSQRDYKYDSRNYKYNNKDNKNRDNNRYDNRANNNRPNRDYIYKNDNKNRNKNNDRNFENNRKDNNRPSYGSNNRQDNKRESSRPTVDRNRSKDNKKSERSSSNRGYRLTSNDRGNR